MIEALKELLNKRAIVVIDSTYRGQNESVSGIIKEIKDGSVRVETDALRSIWLNSKYIIEVKEVR